MDRPEAAPTPQPLVEYDANADSEHLDNDLMLRLVTNRCMIVLYFLFMMERWRSFFSWIVRMLTYWVK